MHAAHAQVVELLVDRRVKRVPDSLGLAVFGFVARSTKA